MLMGRIHIQRKEIVMSENIYTLHVTSYRTYWKNGSKHSDNINVHLSNEPGNILSHSYWANGSWHEVITWQRFVEILRLIRGHELRNGQLLEISMSSTVLTPNCQSLWARGQMGLKSKYDKDPRPIGLKSRAASFIANYFETDDETHVKMLHDYLIEKNLLPEDTPHAPERITWKISTNTRQRYLKWIGTQYETEIFREYPSWCYSQIFHTTTPCNTLQESKLLAQHWLNENKNKFPPPIAPGWRP